MEITIQKSNQLKALAILMMLCLHLFNRDHKGLFEPIVFVGTQPLSYYISLFSDACVPIFCFVSGYGLYFKFQKDQGGYNKGNIKRIKKLYVNYWIILLLFAVGLGFLLNKDGYPGNFTRFVLNTTALDTSYNGAWWFFFTYILLVASSGFFFQLINKTNIIIILIVSLLFYLIAFYFRIYQPNLFNNELLNWLQRQTCLYGTSVLPFIIGAIALKQKWNIKISQFSRSLSYRNTLVIACIILLIAIHGLIPNFIIAPFLAIPFIFLFIQLKLPLFIDKTLDFFVPHATNMWLIHMFFYMTFFSVFIYSPKYVIPIFALLVLCCVLSSMVVNKINILALSKIKI